VRRREVAGQAGVEVLGLGVLVFVIGTLVVANAWAVVDAKFAVAAAAREATRAYVEAAPADDPLGRAHEAARAAIASSGREPQRLTLELLEGGFARCRTVRFEASYPVTHVVLRALGDGPGTTIASARAAELVDPFRSGVPGEAEACEHEPAP